MRTLTLDSTVGGMGDIWMRLTALYSLAALRPELAIRVRIPNSVLAVARIVWPDRFTITDQKLPGAIQITHLGLRHLWQRMCTGEKFLAPFFQIQQADRKKTKLKHFINTFLIHSVRATPALYLPTRQTVSHYQGFHEFSALPEFSDLTNEDFRQQAALDFLPTRQRLRKLRPKAMHPKWNVIVFPSGTAHQVMPPTWAKEHLPEAIYAFFYQDYFLTDFKRLSLETVTFNSVESLLKMASFAEKLVVTDSFPSHPTQAYTADTVVALSQQPRSRIVHPCFDGVVVDSQANCCPCANRARGARGYSRCEAGKDFCVTWSHPAYTQTLLASIG
jgi:hypothetical protein